MSGTILFKFRNARGEPESVSFDGIHITALELKNLIAEKKGLTDSTLELSDPKTKAIYDDNHVFPRGSAVTVRRVAASKAHTRAQQNVTAADITEEVAAGPAMAALQTLAATRAPAASAVHAGDESAQLEQRKANQDKEDAEIGLLVSAQDEAWRAQSDKNILATRAREQQLAAQRGRGRGFGGSFMHGRGRGGQPTGFCKFCGKMNDHFSEDCPQKHNPRTDLRHVRAPAGIPSELLEQSSEGGLLLHTGKTGALKASTGLAAQAFAALPTAAKKGPALPALANAPHEEQQQPLLLGNGNQQKHGDEEDDAEAAGLDSLVQDEASQQEPSAVAAADGDKGPAGTPAVAADIDTDDAYLFDDDFGFGNPDGNTAATDLFEEVEGLPADISGAVQLKLGVGMELPEPEQPEPESLQRHQQSRSPLSQHMQESSVSPLSQPAGHKQQQSPAQHMDKTEDATGLSPVDPLRYCSDIILASIPGSRRWVPKDIRQAFIQDRPLTPDEFFALMERYKAAAPVVMQQQNELKQAPQRQEDSSRRRMKEAGSRRRSRSRSRERSRSLSRSQSRDRAGSKRQRKAEKSPRSHRSRSRSRSRDRHRGSRHRRDRPRDRSRDEQSKSAAASDRAGREHQQERAPRTTAERSASTTLDAGSDKESAGGADQALDRPHDLTTAGPSQDLVGLLEPEDEQQPQPAGAATTAGEAAATAREEPRTEPAHDKVPAAAAATSPEVDKPVKRRPISSRLGPQPRSPVRSASPEHQPQEDLQQADDKTAQTSDAVKPMRSKSGTRSVSRGRSSSRSLSESSGSRGDKKRRSRSRSRTSHSSGQRQKSDNGPAVQDEELLDFGDEDEAIETAVAAEDSQVSDEKHSEKHHRNSKRRTRHSSRKRSKREKKERKEKSGKKKRHRSDRHRSRSRSREGNRRHSQSRSRSTSRSHSRSRSRSRSRGRHRGRSSRHPEIVDRVNSKQDRHADQPANNRESVTTRLGSKAAAEDSVVFTRSGSGRMADAGKRPAPGFGAGRLLGRAFQGLGDAQASRAAEGAKRPRR